jgi:nitroreductase
MLCALRHGNTLKRIYLKGDEQVNLTGVKSFIRSASGHYHYLAVTGRRAFENDRSAAELSRLIHSIEKGLSIESPRPGFGRDKLKKIMSYVDGLKSSPSAYHKELCGVALGALRGYLDFSAESGYYDENCEEIKSFIAKNSCNLEERPGGVVRLAKDELRVDLSSAEKLFKTRHSIRDFSDEDVDDALLKKALKLAQAAPSACNRQAVRAYVLGKEKTAELAERMSGVGGFADKAKRLIMITGKVSSYRPDETNQFIVSASIYAAYLTLSLHACGLASCVVQRPVVWSKEWDKDRRAYSIPEDEQLVLMLAVGCLKDEFRAPVSYRFENDEMIRFL